MRIKKVWAENFRSFGPRCEIPLTGFTLLIGPNNAGKSNVLDVLTTIQATLHRRADLYFIFRACCRSDVVALEIGLEFEDGGESGSYAVRWTGGQDATEEYHGPDFDDAWTQQVPVLLPLAFSRPQSSVQRLISMLDGYGVWRATPTAIARATQVQKHSMVGPSGESAATVLDYLRDFYPHKFDALQEDLRRYAPEVTSALALVTDQPGYKEIVFRERSGITVQASQASEGLRTLLFTLLILHSPRPSSLLAFEGIECGVHPRHIANKVGFLRTLTQSKEQPIQILCTTHSPLVLDQFRDSPEEVVVVERDAAHTTTCALLSKRLDRLQGASSGIALGDLWYSGVLGGVPSQ